MDNDSKSFKESLNIEDPNDIDINDNEAIKVTNLSDKSRKETNLFKVLIFQILATCSFSAMAVFCKLAYRNNSNLNGFDYVLVRSGVMLILSVFQAKHYNINILNIKDGFRLKLYMFAIVGAIDVPLYFIGLQYVPTSIASLIFSISPIIVAVVAPFVLSEMLTKSKVISVVGSFIGCSMFALHKNTNPDEADYYNIQTPSCSSILKLFILIFTFEVRLTRNIYNTQIIYF